MAGGILAAGQAGPLSIQGALRAARWPCLSGVSRSSCPGLQGPRPDQNFTPSLSTPESQFPSQLPPPPPLPQPPLYRLLFFLFVLSLHLHVRPYPVRQIPFFSGRPRQVPPSRFEASSCLFLRLLPPASEQRSRCPCRFFRFSLCYPLFPLATAALYSYDSCRSGFPLHPRNFLPACACLRYCSSGSFPPVRSLPRLCTNRPPFGHFCQPRKEKRTGRLPPLHLPASPRQRLDPSLPMFWQP